MAGALAPHIPARHISQNQKSCSSSPMAFSISNVGASITCSDSKSLHNPTLLHRKICLTPRNRSTSTRTCLLVKCELNYDESSSVSETNVPAATSRTSGSKLQIGSPIIVTEAPQMIKTAASVPCLRVNSGLVKPGDVGRIVSRKPKDVWAVRLAIGTYLIDGKYFRPLELD